LIPLLSQLFRGWADKLAFLLNTETNPGWREIVHEIIRLVVHLHYDLEDDIYIDQDAFHLRNATDRMLGAGMFSDVYSGTDSDHGFAESSD
jgi:hypothetical protein